MPADFSTAIHLLNEGKELSEQETKSVMESIMTGNADDASIEAFLLAIHRKTETAGEIAAAATIMRRHMITVNAGNNLLDTCGTGGDSKNTINISTISSLICAAAGAKIAKHGNRSISSSCGSADIIERLGICIPTTPDKAKNLLEKTGFTFLFAPAFHPAVKYAMPARKKIKNKTLFNILGPLCNPANTSHQVIGVYSKNLVKTLAEVLLKLEIKKAMIVHAHDGTDEISLSGETYFAIAESGSIKEGVINPEDFGIKKRQNPSIHCQNIEEARSMALEILSGKDSDAANMVCVNVAAALFIYNMASDFKQGLQIAKNTLSSGAALRKLQNIVEASQSL